MLRNILKIAGITNEEPGLIDVLNVGDSVCNVSLTPMELFHDYGYTAFNMGRDPQVFQGIPGKRGGGTAGRRVRRGLSGRQL